MSLEQFRSSHRKTYYVKSPPDINVMNAQGACPVSSSATPTMMQFPTGESTRNLSRRMLASIYPVPTRWPLTLSTSSDLPCMEKRPTECETATSP